MRALNDYISESLLDDLGDLEQSSDQAIELTLINKFLKDNYRITGKYTITQGPDGIYIVDSDGGFFVKNRRITNLTTGIFRFGSVISFSCLQCKSLQSLKGAPEKVIRSFNCLGCNSLTSLEGAPKEVGYDFDCPCCDNLISLKGAPKKVGEDFDCSYCKSLTSLEGAPKEIGGKFDYSHCPKLLSSEHDSDKVGRKGDRKGDRRLKLISKY